MRGGVWSYNIMIAGFLPYIPTYTAANPINQQFTRHNTPHHLNTQICGGSYYYYYPQGLPTHSLFFHNIEYMHMGVAPTSLLRHSTMPRTRHRLYKNY
jgi:hypothetical protein